MLQALRLPYSLLVVHTGSLGALIGRALAIALTEHLAIRTHRKRSEASGSFLKKEPKNFSIFCREPPPKAQRKRIKSFLLLFSSEKRRLFLLVPPTRPPLKRLCLQWNKAYH